MLLIIFILLLVTILTIAITVGVWLFFNKESELYIEVSKVLRDISLDTSRILKGLKFLTLLLSEIAQPLLNTEVVDVISEDLPEEFDSKET